jgi:hypothetical protein
MSKKKTETKKQAATPKSPAFPTMGLFHEFQGVHSQMPCSVELSRNAKGAYSWVLKAYGADFEGCISQIEEASRKLQRSFGETEQA